MKNWLYKNWVKLSVLLAIVLTLFIIIFIKLENIILFLIWIQIPIYLLHQFEEHAWNGFKKYINEKVFNVQEGNIPLNEQNIFWINIPIIWILMPIFASLSFINVLFGLWIPYFAIFNSLSHVFFAIRNREYNPGFIVSLILGIPVGMYALIIFYSHINVPAVISIISIFFVILIHIIIFSYLGMKYKSFKAQKNSI